MKETEELNLNEIIEESKLEILKINGKLYGEIHAIKDEQLRKIIQELLRFVWKITNVNRLRAVQLGVELGQIEEDNDTFRKLIKEIQEGNPLDVR